MIEIRLKTLTPLWTGGVHQNCLEVKETGIVGSLRWWYEAVVRAYGGLGCDPTNSSCDKKNHCDVCELFGCSGWSRKFRLEVGSMLKHVQSLSLITRKKREIRGESKFLSRYVSGLCGEMDLRIIKLKELYDNEIFYLYKTLQLVDKYGALGAKTSQGNGVVRIEKINGLEHLPVTNYGLNKHSNTTNFPNLSDFFFSRFQLYFENNIQDLINKKCFWGIEKNAEIWEDFWNVHKFLPIAFHARDALRTLIEDRKTRHEVLGERGKGSKVFVSHGYRIDEMTLEFRMFGYSLENVDDLRKKFIERLPKCISKSPDDPLRFRIQETEFKTGDQLL